ncbi:DUF4174 domain-containing protein [Arsenicibacter rosenii]|uniref:DUF4174 domain-containing protein n=1 Tax=Arsenicibacter rosenii TaxID=1750698 RepID=A0A1S2VKT9_9BACT|nr:DUF4174 domain-containing protein [Arsenicibacter rosenii]OIN58816.1 hypothetical protein BLX24_11315 [Arsenicibacter rosenii]
MESIANQTKSLKAILADKKDHRRVLLLYGREDAQHYLIEQQESLRQADQQVAERDLDVIVLINSLVMEPDRQFLMGGDFKLNPADDFVGWLIGKDGTVKHRFSAPAAPDELFKIIDSMPMRKQEAKKN